MGKTVSQLLGLSPEETNAYLNTIAGEAYLGGQGRDIAGVAANLIARRMSGQWGGTNLVDIAKSPGQYEANFTIPRAELVLPNARRLKTSDMQRIASIAENPQLVGSAYARSGGAQSFRGQALLKNRKEGDVMYEDRGNFYFNPLSADAYEKGAKYFQSAGAFDPSLVQGYNFSAAQQPTSKPKSEQPTTDTTTTTTTNKSDSKKKISQNYLQQYLGQMLSQPSLIQRLIQQDMTQGLMNPQLPQMPTSLSNLFY